MIKLIAILILTLAAISCGKIKDAHNTLNDIETFINERPDSALTILDSFDTSLLENKSVWAHHSLLHAQAKDKCYIDDTNDSLMTQVVNYYEGKRDKEKLFKAYYYLGRIQYNAGNYINSMLSYTKADKLLDNIDDDFTKGLLYAQLGMLHMKYYDYPRSLEAYEVALSYYKLSGRIAHQYYTLLNIGQIQLEDRNYKDAERLFEEVMVWAYNNEYFNLCQESVEFLITLYDETLQVEKCLNLIDSKYGIICPESLHVIQTHAFELAKKGDRDAIHMINQAKESLVNTLADSLSNYYYEYRIHKLLANYQEALYAQEELFYLQDAKAIISLQQPLLSAKNNYLQSENKYIQLKIKSQKNKTYFILMAIVLTAGLLYVDFRKKMIEKNLEIIKYIGIAKELEDTLAHKREEIDSMSLSMDKMDSNLKTCEGYISELFSRQYDLLNKLTSTYYETHVCNKDMEAIYKQVSKEIECLSSDKRSIFLLEQFVNRYKGNIMTIIRTNLNNLTEMEYRLLCYLCAGFSAKAISIFTGDTTNNIYVKKSRLKEGIMKLQDDVAKQMILEAITVK